MIDDDPRGALIYAAAVRALDQQASVVDNVRSRAGILLSATAVATSFLAGIALADDRSLNGWGVAACVSATLVAGLCVWLLWPRREWRFSPSATKLVRYYLDPEDVTLAIAHRNLALHMSKAWDSNRLMLRWMFGGFQAACILLGVEVAFWIADLATRR